MSNREHRCDIATIIQSVYKNYLHRIDLIEAEYICLRRGITSFSDSFNSQFQPTASSKAMTA